MSETTTTTYTVCLRPPEVNGLYRDRRGYPYYYESNPERRDWPKIVLHGDAARLMDEFKELRDSQTMHTAGVLADLLDDCPELAVCAPDELRDLVTCLRDIFVNGGKDLSKRGW